MLFRSNVIWSRRSIRIRGSRHINVFHGYVTFPILTCFVNAPIDRVSLDNGVRTIFRRCFWPPNLSWLLAFKDRSAIRVPRVDGPLCGERSG